MGLPSVYSLYPPRDIFQRMPLEALRGRCQECLEKVGFSRKGIFIPVSEGVSPIVAIQKEYVRIKKKTEQRAKKKPH